MNATTPSPAEHLLADTPWTPRDFTTFAVRSGLGVALIVAAWVGASSTVAWRDQMIWIGVGITGLVVSSLAGVGWLLQGFSRLGRDRHVVRHAVQGRLVRRSAPARAAAADLLVAAASMRYFHRPDCDAAAGKTVEPLTLAECVARDLEPCRMCRP